MFFVKSKSIIPINMLGIQQKEKQKQKQMRTYLGFLHFFFATQFQPDPRLSPIHQEFSSNI